MTDVRTSPSRSSPARARLLAVADELFYADGITATGIDRLIAEAQVTKATFYKQYGSKDALILEYIAGRDRQIRDGLTALLDSRPEPAAVLAAVIDAVVSDTARPDFRGDPFLNAAAEFASPTHAVRIAIVEHRDWFTGFLEDRFRDLGHRDRALRRTSSRCCATAPCAGRTPAMRSRPRAPSIGPPARLLEA